MKAKSGSERTYGQSQAESSPKRSKDEPAQYLDWWPLGNSRHSRQPKACVPDKAEPTK